MAKVLRSAEAEEDLYDIWFYIAVENKSKANADKFIRVLDDTFKRLAKNPKIGKSREEIYSTLRSFPKGRHTIFYFPIADGVKIIRVLSSYRDIEPLFK